MKDLKDMLASLQDGICKDINSNGLLGSFGSLRKDSTEMLDVVLSNGERVQTVALAPTSNSGGRAILYMQLWSAAGAAVAQLGFIYGVVLSRE